MTRQETLDKILEGLSKQNFRKSAATVGGRCVYQSENGDRCAVGHLLTDDDIIYVRSHGLLGASVYKLSNSCSDSIREKIYDHRPFLTEIQMWHDDRLSTEGGLTQGARDELKDIAERYDVEIPESIKRYKMKKLILYAFDELSDEAKEKDVKHARMKCIYPEVYLDECEQSMNKISELFWFKIINYQLSDSGGFITIHCSEEHDIPAGKFLKDIGEFSGFGGKKYKIVNENGELAQDECPFTGTYYDYYLFDAIKEIGPANPINHVINRWCKLLIKAIESEYEENQSDASIINTLSETDYYFTKNGTLLNLNCKDEQLVEEI